MRDSRKHNRVCHYLAFCLQIISLTLVIHDYLVISVAPPNNVPHFHSRDEQLPQRPPSKYKYSYNVRGIEGDQHGHQASHNGAFASGKYYVKLNQGTSQNVEYYTDELGYHPKVVYRSQLDSGRSGARVILGGNANSFSTSIENDPKTVFGESTSTEIPSTVADVTTANKIDLNTAQPTYDTASDFLNPNFGLRNAENIPLENNGTAINTYYERGQNPLNAIRTNQTNEFIALSTSPPPSASFPFAQAAQLAGIPADTYLQPEFNEISNGFFGKIMSVVPGIKFLRPIIVTDVGEQSETVNRSITADIRPDQVVDSAQLHELHQESPYAQLILAGVSVLTPKNDTLSAFTPDKDENTSTEQPKEEYTSVEQLKDEFTSVKQPKDEFTSVKQPKDDDYTSVEQLKDEFTSVKQPKDEFTSVKQPKDDDYTSVAIVKDGQELKRPETIVDVEPQMIEKQAVITTNIDISKSIPLAMNFLPDVDNYLNEPRNGVNYQPNELRPNEQQRSVFTYPPANEIHASNTIAPVNYPAAMIYAQPAPQPLQAAFINYPTNENSKGIINSFPPQINFYGRAIQQGYHNTIAAPSQPVFNGPPRLLQLPFPPHVQSVATPTFEPPQNSSPLPADFRYVSIPILQHQPNVIPLDYGNNGPNQLEQGPPGPINSPLPVQTENQSEPLKDPVAEAESSPTQETIIKRENYPSDTANLIASELSLSKPMKPSFIDPGFHSQQPFAYQVPAAQLIPYVKQITNSPQVLQIHPYAHLLKQQPQFQHQQVQFRSSPIRAHSVSYNVRQFPKDQHRKPLTKTAPFKPSHPVWDSIYPPQHMYQVPYYVVDKIPIERKARDSSYRRNQRRVRRLFVEYGGFKPPMIPSTLLEVEETSDNTEVPTNSAD